MRTVRWSGAATVAHIFAWHFGGEQVVASRYEPGWTCLQRGATKSSRTTAAGFFIGQVVGEPEPIRFAS
jgi:hypothetical protein